MKPTLTLSVLLALAACGDLTERQRLDAAQAALQRQDRAAAVVELKALLQLVPGQGEGRLLLGRALLEGGDAAGAEVELQRALDAGQSLEQVGPLLARSWAAMGKGDALVARFEMAALNSAVSDAEVQTLVAAALLQSGQPDRAEAAIARALKRVPRHAAAQLEAVRLQAQRGDRASALSAVNALLETNPAFAHAWMLKGDLLYRAEGGDVAQVVHAYSMAVAKQADLLPAHVALINLLFEQKDFNAAGAAVDAMRRALPGQPQVAYFDALLALHKGQTQRALEIAQQMLRGANGHLGLLMLVARAEYQLGALEQAEADAIKAVQLAPDASQPRRLLVEILLRNGKADKALMTLKPMLDARMPDPQALALAGQARLMLGDVRGAQELLSKANKARPDDVQIRTSTAVVRLAGGAEREAFDELAAVAKADVGIQADLALISARMGRAEFDAALRAIDALALKVPQQALADFLRARVALLQRDAVAARRHFEAALRKEPGYMAAVTSLVMLDLADKKPVPARARLDALVNAEPGNAEARLALAELVARTGGSQAEVAALLKAAVKAKPSDANTHLALAEHVLAGGDAQGALAILQDGLVAVPGNAALFDRIGRLQWALGDKLQSQATFSNWAAKHPRAALAHLRLADVFLATDKLDAATGSARRALALEPDSLPAQRVMVTIALRERRFDTALTLSRKVQQQWPGAAAGFLLEGEVALVQRHFDVAAAVFQRALGTRGGEEAAPRLHATLLQAGKAAEADRFAEAWRKAHSDDLAFAFYLGDAAMARRDWPAAEARYRAVLDRSPDNAMALNNIAVTLLRQNKPGATAAAERAVRLSPNSPALMDTLASGYAAEGAADKALALQQRVVELVPNSPTFRFNLAKLQLQAGDKASALIELQKLTRLGAAFPDQAAVQSLLNTVNN